MSNKNLEKIRHSLAHLLAMAVLEKFPNVKLGIGPVIENGFYYDFDFVEVLNPKSEIRNPKQIQNPKSETSKQEFKLSPADLPLIEKRMRELIRQDLKFKKEIIAFTEAKKIFKNQPYKLELIKELQSASRRTKKPITIYKTLSGRAGITPYTGIGPYTGITDYAGVFIFTDLCAGPHVKLTSEINPDVFKLTKISGAYWKDTEKNPMLTRIYGVAFNTKKELDDYLKMIEEAEKRDHRILGQKLDLFSFDEGVGAGLPLWHPKGALLRQIIEDYSIEQHLKNGYQLLKTPHIAHLKLWQTSGHWNFYKENMYSPIDIDDEKFMLKPMNCPFHIKVYQSQIRSYKDLPIKFFELGTVYRYERAGVLHGLIRVRGFTQDDSHVFCTPQQLEKEISSIIEFGIKILKTFGFENYDIYLSTRPKKYIGSPKNWDKATKALKYALEKAKLKYQIDPGEGVFYGPKIDIKIKDSLGRAWQCTTIQVDFNLPEKFKIYYTDEKGKKQQPIMAHRALFGSIERFTGVLLEHFSGALPLWLSPVQVEIINVGSAHREYAKNIHSRLLENNIRASISDENLTVSKRIREAGIQKIPYILVVGDKEVENKSVNVRHYRHGQEGEISVEKLIERITNEVKDKTL